MPTVVAFSGTRDLDTSPGSDAERIILAELSTLPPGTIVIHGNSGNVDLAADRIARRFGFAVTKFPADWTQYGKRAGPIRNSEMAKQKPVRWVIIWNGVSPGSRDALRKARSVGAQVAAEYVVQNTDMQALAAKAPPEPPERT